MADEKKPVFDKVRMEQFNALLDKMSSSVINSPREESRFNLNMRALMVRLDGYSQPRYSKFDNALSKIPVDELAMFNEHLDLALEEKELAENEDSLIDIVKVNEHLKDMRKIVEAVQISEYVAGQDMFDKSESVVNKVEAREKSISSLEASAAEYAGHPVVPAIRSDVNPADYNENYMDIPAGKPIRESFDERRVDVMNPGERQNSVDRIKDESAFLREAEKHLAVWQNKTENGVHPWLKKPEHWPSFMVFPKPDVLETIRAAEMKGELDDKMKADLNEKFERYSLLMLQRAKQIDEWIMEENSVEFLEREKNRRFGFMRSFIKKDIQDLRLERLEQDGAGNRSPDSAFNSDPFMDIGWAVLLDPRASSKDPRFKDVARWGHRSMVMHDGGVLKSSEDGFRVPFGSPGTPMAAKMAVMEAFERGWTSIDISGSKEFIDAARAAAQEYGMGAKLTVFSNLTLFGMGKTEYIMPNPPAMLAMHKSLNDANKEHEKLMNDDGKAPDNGSDAPRQLSGSENVKSPPLTMPGLAESPDVSERSESKWTLTDNERMDQPKANMNERWNEQIKRQNQESRKLANSSAMNLETPEKSESKMEKPKKPSEPKNEKVETSALKNASSVNVSNADIDPFAEERKPKKPLKESELDSADNISA